MNSACQTRRPRTLGPAQGIKPEPHQFCSALFSSNCTNGAQPNSYIHIHGPKCCRSFFFLHLPTPERERKKVPSFHCKHRWVNAAGSLSMKSWKSDIFLIKTLPNPLKKEASNRKWWPMMGPSTTKSSISQTETAVVCKHRDVCLITAGRSQGFYQDKPKLSAECGQQIKLIVKCWELNIIAPLCLVSGEILNYKEEI